MVTNNVIDKSINNAVLTGTISANGSVGNAGDVLTSAGAGSPAVWAAASGGGTTWTAPAYNATAVTLAPSNGYFLSDNGAGTPQTVSLPAGAVIGDTYYIVDITGTGWSIIIAGQDLRFAGSLVATSLSSTNINDCATITCLGGASFFVSFYNGTLVPV